MWAWMGLRKGALNRKEGGAEHNLWKNDRAPEHDVNRLKSIGSNQANFNP